MKKTCKECGTSYDAINKEEMREYFYYKKTWSGDYFLNTCITCTKAKRNKRYAEVEKPKKFYWEKDQRPMSKEEIENQRSISQGQRQETSAKGCRTPNRSISSFYDQRYSLPTGRGCRVRHSVFGTSFRSNTL